MDSNILFGLLLLLGAAILYAAYVYYTPSNKANDVTCDNGVCYRRPENEVTK